jgi:hypothetical protein
MKTDKTTSKTGQPKSTRIISFSPQKQPAGKGVRAKKTRGAT